MAETFGKLEITHRAELRAWLEANHGSARGLWVVTFKKDSGRPRVSAEEIGEEALCFGWVDSKVGKVDALRSMLMITPRKPKSSWSHVNKLRIAKLTKAGLMRPSGVAAVALAKKSGTWTALDAVEALLLPDDLTARFSAAAPVARANFDAFPRSVKRGILEWIQTAKRPDTRARRIDETVTLAANGVRANQWRQ